MFTLHGLFKSQIIPLVYALLIGKKASDYDKFFECIMEEGDFNPDSILTDFESGTIKSVKSLFPNALHKGNFTISFINNIRTVCSLYFRVFVPLRSVYLASYSKSWIEKEISRR
jgi:hypothetical protein